MLATLLTLARACPQLSLLLDQNCLSLRNDMEGRRVGDVNTPRVGVSHGVFGGKLGDSVREAQYEDREEEIKISGLFSLSPHHTRNLQFFSVNKQNISCCYLLRKKVHDFFRKVKTFQDWKS